MALHRNRKSISVYETDVIEILKITVNASMLNNWYLRIAPRTLFPSPCKVHSATVTGGTPSEALLETIRCG